MLLPLACPGSAILNRPTINSFVRLSLSRKHQFHLREIDTVRVKGRKGIVNVYELIDELSIKLSDNQKRTSNYYNAGLGLYRQQKWEAAIQQLNLALEYTPLDMPSRIIADRCHHYLNDAPQDNWEGVFEPKIKTL